MIRELFHLGSFSVSPFGVMLVLALLAAYWQLQRAMRFRQLGGPDTASNIVLACGTLGILGGKIYYAMLVNDWGMLLDRAGIVWYGCLIGGAVGFFWMLRRYSLPVGSTFDAAAPALALGYGVGRIGCLLVGDDYGLPTQMPWGMVFKEGLPPTTAGNLRYDFKVEVPADIPDDAWVAVHPTQIYSSLASFSIFALALYLEKRQWLPGNLFLTVLTLLSFERLFVEFFRAKDDRFFGQFTLAQVISLGILLLIAVISWVRRRQARA